MCTLMMERCWCTDRVRRRRAWVRSPTCRQRYTPPITHSCHSAAQPSSCHASALVPLTRIELVLHHVHPLIMTHQKSVMTCMNRCLNSGCGVPAQVTVGDGQPYSGCAADVWSSGCVLCAAALFALPFGNHHQPPTPQPLTAPTDCLAKKRSQAHL